MDDDTRCGPGGGEGRGHDVYTVDETAAELRCSTQTVRRMIKRGDLAAFNVGRLLRVPSSEVRRTKAGR